MTDFYDLGKALSLLCKAQRTMNYDDYVAIWGERLGAHVWRQEGSDILRIWTSGLKTEEKKKFINYIEDEVSTRD